MATFDRTARSFLLAEVISGFALTLKYMFKPKVTVNYPYEKGRDQEEHGVHGVAG